MTLSSDPEFRSWSVRGEPVMWAQTWGYYQEKDNDDQGHDKGERVQASFGFIVKFLSKMDMDLIVKVEIDRRVSRPLYEGSADDLGYVPGSAKYFLIGSDGRISSL
jgi:hypothetical protein